MTEESWFRKWGFLVAVLTLVVAALTLGYMVWQDGNETASIGAREPEPFQDSPDPESSEPPPESPKRQDVSENESPWEATFVISRGAWVSQDAQEMGVPALRRVRVAEPDTQGEIPGVEVELEIIGLDPCQLVLSPDQDGTCGTYDVVLEDVTPETATLKLAER